MRLLATAIVVALLATPGTSSLLSGPTVPEAARQVGGGSLFSGQTSGRDRPVRVPARRWIQMAGDLDLDGARRQEVESIARSLRQAWRGFNLDHGEEWRELSEQMREMRQQRRDAPDDRRRRYDELEAIRPRPEQYQLRIWNVLDEAQQAAFRRRLAEARQRIVEDRTAPRRGE